MEEFAAVPERVEAGITEFLWTVERFFGKFTGMRLGVQLSGGLDSSLIIGLLRYFGIPYSLVGMFTNRYEFRTESAIQRKLAADAQRAILLNYEEHLPLTALDEVPAHQHPDLSSCGFAADDAMAAACVEVGIDVLLSGFGGDIVLGNEAPCDSYPWRPAIFNDTWLQDLVYGRRGVELMPFFGDADVSACIWNMRRGQAADPSKLWARDYFRTFLPTELVNFTYKADFWGIYIDGLLNAIPDLRHLHERAFELTGHPYFAEQSLNDLLSCDLSTCDKHLYQLIEARISSALWYVALLR